MSKPKVSDWIILCDRAPVTGHRGTRLSAQQALASLAYRTYTSERRDGCWETQDYQAYRRAVSWTLLPGIFQQEKSE